MSEFVIQKVGEGNSSLVIENITEVQAKTEELLKSGHSLYVTVEGIQKKVTGFKDGNFLYTEEGKVSFSKAKVIAVPPISGGSSSSPRKMRIPL